MDRETGEQAFPTSTWSHSAMNPRNSICSFSTRSWLVINALARTPWAWSVAMASKRSRLRVHAAMAASMSSWRRRRPSTVVRSPADMAPPSRAAKDRHSSSSPTEMAIQASSPAQGYTPCGAWSGERLAYRGGDFPVAEAVRYSSPPRAL